MGDKLKPKYKGQRWTIATVHLAPMVRIEVLRQKEIAGKTRSLRPLTEGECSRHTEARKATTPSKHNRRHGMKSKCNLCDKKRNLFNVGKDGREVLACSNCITDQLLTGWSK